MRWDDEATRLSYPDWIVERLQAELGADDAIVAMERMNEPPSVHERPDGYVQDLASQWVAELVDAAAGERVLDLCAAPGGKATILAATGATTVAADLRGESCRTGRRERRRGSVPTSSSSSPTVRTRRSRPARSIVFSSTPPVRVSACSGAAPTPAGESPAEDVDELVGLQQRLIDEAADLVRPGGCLVYSVCTLTAAESIDHRFPVGLDRGTRPWPSMASVRRRLRGCCPRTRTPMEWSCFATVVRHERRRRRPTGSTNRTSVAAPAWPPRC